MHMERERETVMLVVSFGHDLVLSNHAWSTASHERLLLIITGQPIANLPQHAPSNGSQA